MENLQLALIFILTVLCFCATIRIVEVIIEVNEDENKEIKRYRRN